MSSIKTSSDFIPHRGNKPESLKTPIATSALSPVPKIAVKHRINGSTSPSVVQRNGPSLPKKTSNKEVWKFMCTVNEKDFEIVLTKDRMCIAATSYDYKKSKIEYEQLDDCDLFTVVDPTNHILKFKLSKRDSIAFRDTYSKFGHISCKSRRVIAAPDFDFTAWESISRKYVKVVVKANGVFLQHPAKVFHWWDSKFNLIEHGTTKVLRVKSVNSGDMLDLTASPTEQRHFADLLRHIRSQGRLDTSSVKKSKEVHPDNFYAENKPKKPASDPKPPNSTSSPKRPGNFLLNQSVKTPIFPKRRRVNEHLPDKSKESGAPSSKGEDQNAEARHPTVEIDVSSDTDVKGDEPSAGNRTSESQRMPEDKKPEGEKKPNDESIGDEYRISNGPSKQAGASAAEPAAVESPKERRRRSRQSVVYLDNDPEMLVEPSLEDYELLKAENYKRVAYRFWDGKSTEVALEDIARLNPHVYVNDTIIWFFLRYFMEKLVARDPTTASHILLLDTFFYSTLRQGDPPSWILKIPLVAKDILIMPIHDHAHWSAAIIVGLRKMYHTPKTGSSDDSESEDLEGEEAYKPTIVILDSLGGTNSRHAGRKVVTALANALKAQNLPPLSPKQFRILRGDVPTQPNSTDCGVYLIHFVEQILSYPQELLKRVETSNNGVLNIDEGYWKPNEAWRKRIELKTLLKGLGNQDDIPQTSEELDCIEVVEVENVANKRKPKPTLSKKLPSGERAQSESGESQLEQTSTNARSLVPERASPSRASTDAPKQLYEPENLEDPKDPEGLKEALEISQATRNPQYQTVDSKSQKDTEQAAPLEPDTLIRPNSAQSVPTSPLRKANISTDQS